MKTTYVNKNVELVEGYDTVIIGGGTAGAIAALSAAREGLKTLIIEQFGTVGGSQTLSNVTPVMPSHVPGDMFCQTIHPEIVERMYKEGTGSKSSEDTGQWYNPVMLDILLNEMMLEDGVDIMLNTTFIDAVVEDGTITGVVVFNTDGFKLIKAKTFIDCSGNAELAVKSGVPYESGGATGLNQSVSLRFEMGNVDVKRLGEYIVECGQTNPTCYPGVTTDCSDTPVLKKFIYKKYEEGELTKLDIAHFQMFSIPGKEGVISFNCPELGTQINVLDSKFMSQKQREARIAIKRMANFCIKYIPGFENAYINVISPMLGVRETRRINAKYVMQRTDIWSFRKFEDGIATSNYPLDIHGATEDYIKAYEDKPDNERYYEIPYRSMIASEIKNLIVAGRCIGADFYAQSTVRVQHTCRAMGEAAGIAAKLSLDKNIDLNQINGKEIREILISRGAEF